MRTNNSFPFSLARIVKIISRLAHSLKLDPISFSCLPTERLKPVSISSLSASISWDLPLPAQPPRAISTFSSSSGVMAPYRDCANLNKSSWKALLPSFPSPFPPPSWNHRGFWTSWPAEAREASLISLGKSTELSEWPWFYSFKNLDTLENSTSRRINNNWSGGIDGINTRYCKMRVQPECFHSFTSTYPPKSGNLSVLRTAVSLCPEQYLKCNGQDSCWDGGHCSAERLALSK